MSYLRAAFDKYKYALGILLLGLFIVMLPSCEKEEPEAEEEQTAEGTVDLLAEELNAVFSSIEGVGRVKVVLTLKSGYRNVYASNERVTARNDDSSSQSERTTEPVIIGSSSSQEALVQQVDYPRYQGALVVCDGGNDPTVQYRLTQAVMSLTGLSADKIVITKMEK